MLPPARPRSPPACRITGSNNDQQRRQHAPTRRPLRARAATAAAAVGSPCVATRPPAASPTWASSGGSHTTQPPSQRAPTHQPLGQPTDHPPARWCAAAATTAPHNGPASLPPLTRRPAGQPGGRPPAAVRSRRRQHHITGPPAIDYPVALPRCHPGRTPIQLPGYRTPHAAAKTRTVCPPGHPVDREPGRPAAQLHRHGARLHRPRGRSAALLGTSSPADRPQSARRCTASGSRPFRLWTASTALSPGSIPQP